MATVAVGDLNGGKVLAEVTSAARYLEAATITGLYGAIQHKSERKWKEVCYMLTLMAVLEKARVAVPSRFCASSVAAGSSLVSARPVAAGGALAAEVDAGGCEGAGAGALPWVPKVKVYGGRGKHRHSSVNDTET